MIADFSPGTKKPSTATHGNLENKRDKPVTKTLSEPLNKNGENKKNVSVRSDRHTIRKISATNQCENNLSIDRRSNADRVPSKNINPVAKSRKNEIKSENNSAPGITPGITSGIKPMSIESDKTKLEAETKAEVEVEIDENLIIDSNSDSNLDSNIDSDSDSTSSITQQYIISGSYSDDLNILEVDKEIKSILKAKNAEVLAKSQALIDATENQLKNCKNMVEYYKRKKLLKELADNFSKAKNSFGISEYLKETGEVIEEYRKIGVLLRTISVTRKNDSETSSFQNAEQRVRRHQIIQKFLTLAQKYIPLNFHRISSPNVNCAICKTNMEGSNTCSKCGYQKPVLENNSYQDKKNNPILKGEYEDRKNFRKAILRYQGKLNIKLPPKLFENLDNFFTKYGLECGERVRERMKDYKIRFRMRIDKIDKERLQRLESGEKGEKSETKIEIGDESDINDDQNWKEYLALKQQISREFMYRGLSEVGCEKLFPDINLIGHLYWGWELPEISHLEDQLMKNYDASQRVLDDLKVDDRTSNLNMNFLLFNHLKLLNYPCSEKDFKIVKTPDTLDYYRRVWNEVKKRMNWM